MKVPKFLTVLMLVYVVGMVLGMGLMIFSIKESLKIRNKELSTELRECRESSIDYTKNILDQYEKQ